VSLWDTRFFCFVAHWGMRHHFQAEQWVPFPKESVFAFFANPANLPQLMPAWQKTRIDRIHLVPPPGLSTGIAAGEGSSITISFRPVPFLPLRLAWVADIAEFQLNEFFCDEQQKGPFHSFRHCHRLRTEERASVAGTLITDAVDYELPLGVLGDLVNGLGVRRQIRSLFAHRQRTLLKLLPQA
jgi:ligand-binding SRPBCC domain-containing protein